MKIRMIGCSHHSTPVEVREKFSFTDAQTDAALNLLRDQYGDCESVLLSTCNRVELYIGSAPDAELPSTKELVQFVAKFHSQDVAECTKYFSQLEDENAVRHLFSVASSIDSLIVGESQIAAQVHSAYEQAVQKGFAGPALHAAFQHANQVAKRVTNETEIHRRRISVPSVAVSEVASEFFERFDDKRVLVIGSGEMGYETVVYLRNAGAKNISIVNRSYENGCKLAQEFGVDATRWELLEDEILKADLIVSTTGATEPIMTRDRFESFLPRRTKGTLLILDLAVPRDFEASIGDLDDIFLYSVDDLQAVCDRNRSLREQQLPKAERIISEEVKHILSDWQLRSSTDTIRALRDRASEIRELEFGRLMSKQALQGATPELQQEINHAFDRLVNKLLHQPLQSIREVDQSDQREPLVHALRKLFKIR